MPRRKNTPLDLLVMAPWWVSVIFAVVAYAGLRWIFPALAASHNVAQVWVNGFAVIAPYMALLFGMVAVASAIFGARRRRLVDQQSSLETLRATPWKEFEFLVAEAYRRRGYEVAFSIVRGADGGIDLVLRQSGRTVLVQCKQYKVFSVGAPVVRELFGIMTAEHADEAIVVTSGRFTLEARAFAEGKSITLVDGPQLLDLVKSVQSTRGYPTAASAPLSESRSAPELVHSGRGITAPEARPAVAESEITPTCPQCGKHMVIRTARHGTRASERFWGCMTFPHCKGTRPA